MHRVFQSTRPVRDATAVGAGRHERTGMFQSTRPVRDATSTFVVSTMSRSLVSIHASRAGRDRVGRSRSVASVAVSIHASRAGRDTRSADGCVRSARVSIHASRAGRDWLSIASITIVTMFQSTRPVRDATVDRADCGQTRYSFNPRVPCGTRHRSSYDASQVDWFQSTRPVRDATTTAFAEMHQMSMFQSTRPVRDATRSRSVIDLRCIDVSIHASRAGRDVVAVLPWLPIERFNPRVPCGTRLANAESIPIGCQRFNPRVPCGTRRALPIVNGSCDCGFNPRVPCGTRHAADYAEYDRTCRFQSTRPVRDATMLGYR